MSGHIEQILAHLEADPLFKGKVIDTFDGSFPAGKRPAPYLVLHSSNGDPAHERLTAVIASRLDFNLVLHAVGEDARQARAWASRARARLEGFMPKVPGWNPSRVKHTASQEIDVDRDMEPPMIYAGEEFLLVSRKAKDAP